MCFHGAQILARIFWLSQGSGGAKPFLKENFMFHHIDETTPPKRK
jgi:hypothetical protein